MSNPAGYLWRVGQTSVRRTTRRRVHAALYFELNYNGGVLFGKQVGYAKLIDGTWKVSRDTMCMVFAWGGGQCDPPPDPARSTTGSSAN